jgi:hypothetical protein
MPAEMHLASHCLADLPLWRLCLHLCSWPLLGLGGAAVLCRRDAFATGCAQKQLQSLLLQNVHTCSKAAVMPQNATTNSALSSDGT